jgi:SAM-dependent methyltransferase
MKKIPNKRIKKQLIEQYHIEKELANRLKIANKKDRKNLYTKLYDELFERVPHHPQLTRKKDKKLQQKAISGQVKLLSTYFSREKIFMELGSGDCALSFEMCKYFKKVYAIDVSDTITKNIQKPTNFELIISDGSSIDVVPESINIAYSNQLMEHLHPDDAIDQLQGVYNALVPGGIYICITPHRFKGPSDISKYFDEVATGFHLKEYTITELIQLFKSVGFRKIINLFVVKSLMLKVPVYPAIYFEKLIDPVPHFIRKRISTNLLVNHLMSIKIVATK